MTKDDFKKKIDEAGDAVITYKSLRSRKQKYNICTRDFSTKYIQEKKTRAKEDASTVLLFCWDTDSYRLLKLKKYRRKSFSFNESQLPLAKQKQAKRRIEV